MDCLWRPHSTRNSWNFRRLHHPRLAEMVGLVCENVIGEVIEVYESFEASWSWRHWGVWEH
jgi:hypothetical protein